jgi:hypothetical protein
VRCKESSIKILLVLIPLTEILCLVQKGENLGSITIRMSIRDESGKVMARAQADGSGVSPAMRCGRRDGTTMNGKWRAAARPGWLPCLAGLINRVNPSCWGGGMGLSGCA